MSNHKACYRLPFYFSSDFFRSIWCPLVAAVHDWPLAVLNSSTLTQPHIHPTDLWSKEFEQRNQKVGASHDESQKWYFLGGQELGEGTLVEIWDSAGEEEGGIASSKFILLMLDLDGEMMLGTTSLGTNRISNSYKI